MSKKRKKSVPVQSRKDDSNVIIKLSSVEATRLQKPYQVVGFRTGAHMTQKDRPRNNNWKKWDLD